MKKLLTLAAMFLFVAGCGHNRLITSKTMGFGLEVPFGEGSVVLAVGSHESSRTLIRGSASVETTTTTGAGLFGAAAGQSTIVHLKANAQLNEGYLADVMMSTNCPDEAKIALARNLSHATEAPFFPVSVLQTKESTIHLGKAAVTSNSVEQLQGHTGIDLIVDKVTDVIGTNIANNVVNVTGNVVHDVTNPLQGTVTEVHGTVDKVDEVITNTRNTMVTLLGVIALLMCLFVVIVVIFRKGPTEGNRHIFVPPVPTTPPDEPDEPADDGAPDVPRDENEEVLTPETPAPAAPVKQEDQEPKPKWTTRLMSGIKAFIMGIKLICEWILMIPSPARKWMADSVKDYIKSRADAKAAKKKARKVVRPEDLYDDD